MAHRVLTAASAAVLALAGVQTAGVFAAGATPSDSTTPCSHWVGPGSIDATGRPTDFKAGDPAGIYVWHDCMGWHLRSMDPDPTGNHLSSGTVTIDDGNFHNVTPFQLESDDIYSVTGGILKFKFKNDSGKDGLDFRISGEAITFKLQSPGPGHHVYLGHSRTVTPANTFTSFWRGAVMPGLPANPPPPPPGTGMGARLPAVHHPVQVVQDGAAVRHFIPSLRPRRGFGR